MRQQVPRISQEPPSNARGSLAGRWYESVHNERPQVDERVHIDNNLHGKSKNLGNMFVENQMVMDRATNSNEAAFSSREAAIAALTAARNNIHTPSISSTQDMERAQQTMFDDEYRNDESMLPIWPPPELDPFYEDDEFEAFTPTMNEEREMPPSTKYPNANQKYQMFAEETARTSAFNSIRAHTPQGKSRITPTPALADAESMTSPRGENINSPIISPQAKFHPPETNFDTHSHNNTLNTYNPRMRYEPAPSFQNVRVTPELVSTTTTTRSLTQNSILSDTNSMVEPGQQIATTSNIPEPSIFDFLKNPCGPAFQSTWTGQPTGEDRNIDTARSEKSNKPSFWSYIDPNDDLKFYDDAESVSSSEQIQHSPKKSTRTPKGSARSPKTPTRSQKTPRNMSSGERQTGKASNTGSANEDLTYLENENQRRNPSTPGRQSPRTPKRGAQVAYSENLPLKYNRSLMPERSASRSRSPGKDRPRSKSPDPRSRPPRRNAQDPNHIQEPQAKGRSNARVRVTVTSNVPQKSKQNKRPPVTSSSRGRARQRTPKEVNEDKMHEAPTPRASNKDGYETTAAFASSSHHPNTQQTDQFNFAQEDAPTKLRSTTPKKASADRNSSIDDTYSATSQKQGQRVINPTEVSGNGFGTGVLGFTPDFYMLEALGKEFAAGVPTGFQDQNGFPAQDVAGGSTGFRDHKGFPALAVNGNIVNEVSNLSSDDSSGMSSDTKRLKEKLNQVRNRSMKNMERLKQIQGGTHRIPEQLPLSPRKETWASFDKDSTAAIENANCFKDFTSCGRDKKGDEKVVHRRVDDSVVNTTASSVLHDGSDNVTATSSATSSSGSGSSYYGTNTASKSQTVDSKKHEEFQGHYMYIAYSRFGEDAKEVLQLCEHQNLPARNTRNGEVMIKVMSATVTATDCEIRRGEWADVRLSPYIIPGSTFVGKIDDSEKKSAFSSFKPGDTVLSLVKSGSNARYMCVAKNELVKVPPQVDTDLAACLPEIYLTAFQVLHMNHRYGSIRYRDDALKGQSILVMNGHSSLGRAVIELSLAAGASFCYGLTKPRQADAVSKLGGVPLSKDPQDWLTLIGRQIDLLVTVMDGLTMYTDTVTKDHLKALNKEGEVVIVGQRGVDNSNNIVSTQSHPGSRLFCKSHKIQDRTKSYNVYDSWESDKKLCKRDLEHLIKLLGDGRLNPEILERIPLSKIAKAQSIVETKKLSGHIICKPWFPQTYLPN